MTPDRIRKKVSAYSSAWTKRFLQPPRTHNQLLALCVAIHETGAGDFWPGPDGVLDTPDDEHDWGATTLRPLTAEEEAVVRAAGVYPTVGPGHETAARAAMAAIAAAGLPFPQGVIHCDSSPQKGAYFEFFASFPTDELGADYFIRLLCLRRDGTRKPAYDMLLDEHGTPAQLATAMYHSGYFTGVHKPAGTTPEARATAAAANIADYTHALNALLPAVSSALAGGQGPAARRVLRVGSSGADVREWQRDLGVADDGVFGPVTERATRQWQVVHGLAGDSVVGPLTWARFDRHDTEPPGAA